MLGHTDILAATLKSDYESDLSMIPDLSYQQQLLPHSPVRSDDQKSVIKYLLSSPSSSSKMPVSTNILTNVASAPVTNVDISGAGKKSAKQLSKLQNKAVVKKPKKLKTDSLSSALGMEMPGIDQTGSSLKMKILSSSDPSCAQVTLNSQILPATLAPQSQLTHPAKHKKHKKIKEDTKQGLLDGTDMLGLSNLEPADMSDTVVKKPKKVSKKKEKLIQDAITAAQQMPNLAALGRY